MTIFNFLETHLLLYQEQKLVRIMEDGRKKSSLCLNLNTVFTWALY